MGRLRNHRHELFAQALAEGKSRAEAMIAAGYPWHRGNHNRLAQLQGKRCFAATFRMMC
jgi:hypothetical protein